MRARELRFEAAYFGLLGVLATSVYLVRFGADARAAGIWLAAAAGAGALLFAVSVRSRLEQEPVDRGGRARSETAQRMLPLLLLAALLAMAGDRTPAAVAAGCLTGWAAAAFAGFLGARGRAAAGPDA